MLNEQHRRYVQSFLLVIPMTGIVTAVNTVVARGPGALLTMGTLHRWGISIVIAYPSVLVIYPLAAKLTDRLIKH